MLSPDARRFAVTAFARSALGFAVSGTFAVSAAFIAAPPTVLTQSASMPSLTVGSEAIALTAFNPIEDQVAIISTYAQQAVDAAATWVDDLVTPLATGQFWPLSGLPGSYIANSINSTADFAAGLASTVAGFVQAEIDYFGGFVPNVFDYVANAVQNIINWVTGLVPWPLAANVSVPAAVAATTSTAPRAAAVAARATSSAAAENTTAPARAKTTATPPSQTAGSADRGPRSASATRQSTASAMPRGAASTRTSARVVKPAAARARG